MITSTLAVTVGTAPTTVPLQLGESALYYALIFFVLAIVAGLVGARGVQGTSMQIARILVVVFLVLAVLSLLL